MNKLYSLEINKNPSNCNPQDKLWLNMAKNIFCVLCVLYHFPQKHLFVRKKVVRILIRESESCTLTNGNTTSFRCRQGSKAVRQEAWR